MDKKPINSIINMVVYLANSLTFVEVAWEELQLVSDFEVVEGVFSEIGGKLGPQMWLEAAHDAVA